jgi:hypothetical protein
MFVPISRAYGSPGFVEHTLVAVAREVLIMGAVILAVWHLRAKARLSPDAR